MAKQAKKATESFLVYLLHFIGSYATLMGIKEAYQGSKAPNVGFMAHVSAARANDGTIFRNLNKGTRWFVSDKGKWQGMVGVSGKMRASLEMAFPNLAFDWVQQGSKNYYYTKETETVCAYLSK